MGQSPNAQQVLRKEAARLRHSVAPPATWRSIADVQPLLRAAELLVQANDVDAAIALLQPKVYDVADKASPINRLSGWSEWRAIAHALDIIMPHEAAITRPADRLAVIMVLGTAYERLFDSDRAQPYLDSALNMAREQADLRAEAFVLSRIANVRDNRGDTAGCLALSYEALTIARRAGDTLIESALLCNIGFCYREQGRIRHATTFYEEAWKIARRIKDEDSEAWYGMNIVSALLATGDNRAALAFTDQYLPRALRIGSESSAYILGYKGNALAELGRFDEARAAYELGLALAQKSGFTAQLILAYIGLAELALKQGDTARAHAAVTRAESETAWATDNGMSRPQIYVAVIGLRAALLYAEGDSARAALYYQRMRDVAAASEVTPFEVAARIGTARILADAGENAAALTELLHAYAAIADSEHIAHAQTVAALRASAAAWPDFPAALATSPVLSDAQRAQLQSEFG